MNFKKYHVSKNLLDWSGNLITINGTVTTNQDVISSMIDVRNINTLYFTGDISLMNSGVYRLAKSNSAIDSGSTVDSYSSNFTGGIYDVSDCNFLLVTASVYGKPAENAQLIKSSYMCNVGSTPQPYEPYSSEVWHDIPHYIHNTSTDTITTLPTDIYANDNNATVGLKGNMSQSGTPTPDNPIQPQECGERTGNLWNAEGFSARAINSTHEHSNTNPYGTTLSSTTGKEVSITQANYPTGNAGYQNGFFMIDVDFSKYAVGDVVTISFDYIVNEIHSLSTQKTTSVYVGKDSNAAPLTLSSGDWKISGRLTAKITIIADMRPYVEVRLCGNSITVKNIMLNTGSQPLPYESYGYKIPILSGGVTTNVYLGEVETTRNTIKKVFTGSETWYYGDGVFTWLTTTTSAVPDRGLCSHFNYGSPDTDGNFNIILNAQQYVAFQFRNNSISSLSDFKQWLADQYTVGTPVTVWYRRATPLTTTLNEPIRKIGDYADEVSGITIPTIAGANTISVDTTLQPSEVTATYKGWHPMSAVHERENGQWD